MNPSVARLIAPVRRSPVAAGCFVAVIALAVVNYYLWQERSAVAERDEEARRNGEFMLQALTGRTRVDTDLLALHEAMADINGNLIDEHSMEVNLGYFYRFEKQTRVRLTRLNQLAALPPPAGAHYKAVPFSMQIAGPYRNTMSFLRALESGSRLVRVRNCSFERTNETSTDLLLDLTVEILAKP